MTLRARGLAGLSLQIAEHAAGGGRRVVAERSVVVHGVLVHAAAREGGDPEHREASPQGLAEGAGTEVEVAHVDLS